MDHDMELILDLIRDEFPLEIQISSNLINQTYIVFWPLA